MSTVLGLYRSYMATAILGMAFVVYTLCFRESPILTAALTLSVAILASSGYFIMLLIDDGSTIKTRSWPSAAGVWAATVGCTLLAFPFVVLFIIFYPLYEMLDKLFYKRTPVEEFRPDLVFLREEERSHQALKHDSPSDTGS